MSNTKVVPMDRLTEYLKDRSYTFSDDEILCPYCTGMTTCTSVPKAVEHDVEIHFSVIREVVEKGEVVVPLNRLTEYLKDRRYTFEDDKILCPYCPIDCYAVPCAVVHDVKVHFQTIREEVFKPERKTK